MIRPGLWMVAVLALAVIASAVAVVHTKYRARLYFGQLQELRAQRDAVDIEWNRLRLEEAALSTHVRIERKARYELDMFAPRLSDVLFIEDTTHDR
ncbi:cell division protein FtsL [Chromatium okenii]|uniref:cell division protein FtsL n=1 Tax=Chromatium okenii TaxID=61644 RepID=UPI0019085FBA|nr:cell division protein FtsL [Chromatium okenii]MBK1642358.1 cell division protein FtsL [Chromatium okenii]